MHAAANAGIPRSDPDPDQLFTFDDIERYETVVYNGDLGYVFEKGSDVSVANGEHLKIEFVETDNRATDDMVIRRNLVNKYLREQRQLWVDFGHNLNLFEE